MAVANTNNLDPQLIISKLLAELGDSWLSVHSQVLEAITASNVETLRILSATNLSGLWLCGVNSQDAAYSRDINC
jgi:hypothetical protein